MQSIEERLKAFLEGQGKSPRVTVRGVAVFPDGYDLSAANEDDSSVEEGEEVRVINASELPKELLKPLHDYRLSPTLYRMWLHASLLRDPSDDSIALTWLDPDGDTIAKRAGTVDARKPTEYHRSLPPMTGEVLTDAHRRPAGRKIGTAIAAGLSLLLGLGAYVLWEIYPRHEPTSQQILDRPVIEESRPLPVSPQPEDSPPVQPREAKEEPGRQDSKTLQNVAPPPKVAPPSTNLRDSAIANTDPPSTVAPAEKSSEPADPPEPTASWRKTVEHQIDKAIQMRAVDGVVVVFINDTAYLTGAVLSEKQRAAAEEAARNVLGVKRVQSSISVKWDRMTDG
jgi:hypothetical protein